MGAVMKLVQQTILCLNRLSAYEGMRLARAYGLDQRLTQDVLTQSFAQSYVVDNWLERFVVKDEDPESKQAFALVLHTITPALELARDLGIGLPFAALAQQMFPFEKMIRRRLKLMSETELKDPHRRMSSLGPAQRAYAGGISEDFGSPFTVAKI